MKKTLQIIHFLLLLLLERRRRRPRNEGGEKGKGGLESFPSNNTIARGRTTPKDLPGGLSAAAAAKFLDGQFRRLFRVFPLFQVSWFRASDSQVLATGWTKFTGDRRFQVLPADRSHSWGLTIRNVTPSDTGLYLCQVNTEPKIGLPFHLSVTGEKNHHISLTTLHRTSFERVENGRVSVHY
jgi:hypothetical protein